jgi:hypothetical protein
LTDSGIPGIDKPVRRRRNSSKGSPKRKRTLSGRSVYRLNSLMDKINLLCSFSQTKFNNSVFFSSNLIDTKFVNSLSQFAFGLFDPLVT